MLRVGGKLGLLGLGAVEHIMPVQLLTKTEAQGYVWLLGFSLFIFAVCLSWVWAQHVNKSVFFILKQGRAHN